jgi:hypothetical protein
MKFLNFKENKYKLIRNIISHPAVLAFVATIVILLIFPLNFPKYKAEITDQKKNGIREVLFWDDLENDGTSDMIYALDNNVGTAALAVRLYPSLNIVEWDLRGKFSFNRDEYVFTGDYDANEKKEVYAFTLSHDTIYLHIIADFKNPKPTITNRFIATVGQVDGKSDPEIIEGQMDDLNSDGFKELIFGVTTGFSIFPRNVYAYDVVHDRLFNSPINGFQIQGILQENITGGKENELLVRGFSAGNTKPDYPYNDSSCWLIAFDRQLNFLFEPVEFPGVHGVIYPFEDPNSSGLFVLWHPPVNSKKNTRLYRFDCSGKITLEHELVEIPQENIVGDPFVIRTANEYSIVIPTENRKLFLYDTTFHFKMKINSGISFFETTFLDIDEDGQNEILAPANNQTQMGIFRSDLRDPVIVDLALFQPHQTRVSLKQAKGTPPHIFITSGDMQYIISYMRNPFYYLKWIIYLGIYVSILLFTLLVSKIQKSQLQRRFKTEKKITELQLKIVRNQMDPHFTMNAINSVMEAINRQEREEAQQNLMHFSKMYRSLVLSADKIKRTLEEEIDFTRNYLELEKFRFKGQFNYSIEISPDVNLKWEIPKMIIQSPVENAIKHGFYGNQQAGLLTVVSYVEGRHLVLKINDNGIGRQQASNHISEGTGKGLKIMEEFLDLYEKITGIKITSRTEDLYSENGQPAGTIVTVLIPIS